MGSNFNPQGTYDPTQKVPTSTQYGNNQYAPPPPYNNPYSTPPPRRGNGWLFSLLGVIGLLLVIIIVLLFRFLPSGNSPQGTATTPTATIGTPTQQPTVGSSPTVQPTTGHTGPIAEGDFLYSPGPVTGPAIVEFWNGQSGANDVCGTFQLPSGESFNYKAGHWWKYKSDQDMQADWPLHLALYNQKPENAPCTRGQRPPA